MSAATLQKRLAGLNKVPDTATRAAAKEVERIAEQEGSRAGAVKLGRKKRRVRLTATTRVRGSGNTVSVTVWGKPTGPWVWVSSGTSAHAIPKRKPTKNRPRPMHGAGYEHPISRKQIEHPGAHGKGAWQQVRSRAERDVPKIFRDEIRRALSGG